MTAPTPSDATAAVLSPLLEVRGLQVSFDTPDGRLDAVRGLSFSVARGKVLGIVGESGSGKSVATQTIVRLARGARVSGSAHFDGRDLLTMTMPELRAVRGRGIAMIFQNPLSSLHPLYTVGWQIIEMITAHDPMPRKQARARAVELLRLVGIPRPDRRVDEYPHQFSGGMLQRAMIAMALALNPALLIADEPTTALDVTVQAQILRLLQQVQREFGTAIILITHDLGVISEIADDVMVMYAGRAMETAPRDTLFRAPGHPYTRGLFGSRPSASAGQRRLIPIAGQPPSLIALPVGCAFAPRCAQVEARCRVEAPVLAAMPHGSDHRVACWLSAAQ